MKKSALSVNPIQTTLFHAGENLVDFIVSQTPAELVHEKMILAITSKIVSLAEGRTVEKSSIAKPALIEREADLFLGEVGFGCYLTIKEGLMIPSAGIDESNSEDGNYILYPANPFASAENLWRELRARWGLRELGILMTDSHSTPLRRGVTGISLAHWGLHGLRDLVGSPDLFGRKMKMTTVNIADALATAATLMMGEADECQPLAVIDCADVIFAEKIPVGEVKMPLEEDLYYPFFKSLLPPRK